MKEAKICPFGILDIDFFFFFLEELLYVVEYYLG